MKLKEGSKFDLNTVIWGSPNSNRMYSIIFTVGGWSIAFLLGLWIYFAGNPTLFMKAISIPMMIASIIGLVAAMIGLIGMNDFDRYDWNVWRRMIIYNLIMFLFCLMVSTAFIQKVSESAKTLTFHTKNVDGCEHSVLMRSANMKYEFCTDLSSEVDPFTKKGINVEIFGEKLFGELNTTHYEINHGVVTLK